MDSSQRSIRSRSRATSRSGTIRAAACCALRRVGRARCAVARLIAVRPSRRPPSSSIRFAHPAPTAHGWHIWAEQFKKTIEEKSGGKIQVQIFPNAQMGNERDTAQAVRLGSIEMGAIGVGLMNWVPEMSITDAPFLWKSRAQCVERDRRPVRRRPAQALARQGLRADRLDRPRLSQHDQQQAADQRGEGHAEPQDARAELEGLHRDDAGHRAPPRWRST